MAVKTNVGRAFLYLIDKHFPKSSPLHKYFNRSNVKVSYSCMPNISSIISSHNNRILGTKTSLVEGHCNCNDGIENCPLQGKCMTESLVYKAIVKTENDSKEYIGLSSTEFKKRYSNHKTSFNLAAYSNRTGLSKYIWKLKEKNTPYDISWKIITLAPTYQTETKKCQLCLNEKTLIILSDNT